MEIGVQFPDKDNFSKSKKKLSSKQSPVLKKTNSEGKKLAGKKTKMQEELIIKQTSLLFQG